jgi:hypothetical protein
MQYLQLQSRYTCLAVNNPTLTVSVYLKGIIISRYESAKIDAVRVRVESAELNIFRTRKEDTVDETITLQSKIVDAYGLAFRRSVHRSNH